MVVYTIVIRHYIKLNYNFPREVEFRKQILRTSDLFFLNLQEELSSQYFLVATIHARRIYKTIHLCFYHDVAERY